MSEQSSSWLTWVTELQAIAQIGRHYCRDHFCKERYERLQAIAAEISAYYSNIHHEKIIDLFHAQYGYATPHVDLRGLVVKDKRILLVQEHDDHLWSLPGGWADVNATPSENIEREVVEESGFQVKATRMLAFYDKLKHAHPPQMPHTYKCFFLCEIIGGAPRPSAETLAVEFFPINKLPPLSINRVTEDQIKHLYQLSLLTTMQAEFD